MEAEPVPFPSNTIEPLPPPPIALVWPSFQHPVALRAGIFAASLATLLCLMLMQTPLPKSILVHAIGP